MVLFEPINKEEMRESERHYFVTCDELMNIGLESQATSIINKETTKHVLCASQLKKKNTQFLYKKEDRK